MDNAPQFMLKVLNYNHKTGILGFLKKSALQLCESVLSNHLKISEDFEEHFGSD